MKKTISLILSLVLCLSLLTGIVSAAENPFTDVKEGKFYYDAVLWAVDKNITAGTTATTFSPDATCTRGQVVTFLWRAFGEPEPTQTEHPFTDVKESAFYYKAMLWAVENEITSGMTATTFAPNGNCNRGQVVTFLHRAAGKPVPTKAEHPFTDVKETAFYYQAMLWAVENGITSGMTTTTFVPNGNCNRGQVVTFLYRTLKDGIPEEKPTDPTEPSEKPTDPTEKPTEPTEPKPTECSHKYDNACDDACNLCGEKRTPATHVYDNACDASCNVCGKTRTPVDHVYDNACDASCNVCGKTRTPADHVYDDGLDADCNVCGTLRDVLTITSQPTDPKGAPGDTVSVSVSASGGVEPLSYRWEYAVDGGTFMPAQLGSYFNGYNADTLSFTIEPTDFTLYNFWHYRCVITDAAGTEVISDIVELLETVPPLVIVNQPTDISAKIHDPVVYTAVAEGGKGSYTYQWQYMSNMQPNWMDITGDHGGLYSDWQTADLKVNVISDHYNDQYLFRCVITDTLGNSVTSHAAALNEFVPLSIYQDGLKDAYAADGEYIEFTVIAHSGLPTYTYQWYWKMDGISNAVPFDGTEGWYATGYNSPTLGLIAKSEMFDNNAFVFCKVTDQSGDEVETKKICILPFFAVYAHTASRGVELGEVADIEVSIQGGKAPYTYKLQRRFGSNDTFKDYSTKTGITDKTYTFKEEMKPEQLDMLPEYRIVVIDSNYKAVETRPIAFWEYKELAITSQPQNAENVQVGDTATFTVEASGSDTPLRYQWFSRQVNGSVVYQPIEGATEASYTHTFTEADRKYTVEFYCQVTDKRGHSVLSDVVRPTYRLWIKSQSKTEWRFLDTDKPTFLVSPAGGSGTYTYEWEIYFDQNRKWSTIADKYSWIDATTTNTYAVKILRLKDWYECYSFRCKVSDGTDVVYSEPIRIDVRTFEALSIASQPQDVQNAKVGDTVSFTVQAAGSEAPFSYKWMYKYSNESVYSEIPGATSATYTRTLTEDDQLYDLVVYCIVSDATGDRIFTRDAKPIFPVRVKAMCQTEWDLTVHDQPTFWVEAAGGSGTYAYEWEIYFDQNRKWSTIASKYSWIDANTTMTPSMTIIRLKDWYECYSFRCKIIDAGNPENYVYSDIIRIDVGY